MSLLILMPNRETTDFETLLKQRAQHIEIDSWPRVEDATKVKMAVCWNHPEGELTKYPNLELIQSFGAGVDHILRDDNLPRDVQISRVIDPALSSMMAQYVLASVLFYHRQFDLYESSARQKIWHQEVQKSTNDVVVGIMGLGQIGEHVATTMSYNGFKTIGWSRTKKEIIGVETFDSSTRDEFLKKCDYLICLLPLTEATEQLINKDFINKIRPGCVLINVARGEIVDERALCEALDESHLRAAVIDVASQEPLPQNHFLWGQRNLRITPHIASITDLNAVVELTIRNYQHILAGTTLENLIDRRHGY